jgi:glycosyltransferase involved in cell wall biosynthesis|tara:strand:- start:651 stop:1382 length:732 start_codon:yes stop_codon:yes gene_type:complete
MTIGKPDLSVVLLCYRSEDAVSSFVEQLKSCLSELNIDWEIILVSNYLTGSNDRTPEIARSIARQDPRIKALTKEKEGMMGWDMKSGFGMATGNVIAVTDGDGQFPLADVGRTYKKLIEDDLDMVKAYRIKRADGWYRRCLSAVYNFIFHIFFPRFPCHDVNSKPKIFKKDALRKMDLISDDWFIDAEIMIQARRLKFSFAEISTQFRKLDSRTSFVKPGAIIEFIINMILFRIREFRFPPKD